MGKEHLRQAAYEANMELKRQGLVSYTFVNACAIALPPAGVAMLVRHNP